MTMPPTFSRFLALVVLSAMLPSCGESQAQMGMLPTSRPLRMSLGAPGSDLLYAANVTTLFVFAYPKTKYIGEMTLPAEGGGGQVCSDGGGDIFVPVQISSSQGEILEYAHGGTSPIATLNSPTGFQPYACAVDRKSGNLAVTDFPGTGFGSVEVYQSATGTPTVYSDRRVEDFIYCTYDDKSNLFVTTFGGKAGNISLAELPSGGSKFTNITITGGGGGFSQFGIQWDGKYITLARFHSDGIYRMKIAGEKAMITGITHLKGARDAADGFQYWIQGRVAIRPTGNHLEQLGLWNYPAGGAPIRIIGHHFGRAGVFGATVSLGSGS